ncbi:glycine zipper 2TM domain-containing protein [Piscinibacter aquaticus]|uniref:Glycine zipper 2TM domain-containing protein n=1 Tax=Piscinibacter aquaticus TaxID=392597 RepID=A0A5C6U6K6_9BURK|nr:glycine zipper 2TM domain-containing protein [Piscinibacter aquaticus]
MSNELSPGAVPQGGAPSRTVWLIAGVLGAASLAAGAGMLARNGLPPPAGQPVPEKNVAAETRPADKPAQKLAAAPRAAAPAELCRDCGVVESVQAVTRKGEANGTGAVVGGVLGAVVGNQMGKGDGRKAMTVLGAVGGGVAGHEIEKRAKSTTVHVVKVRMDDGSLRTIEQAAAARTGERVIVEGNKMRPMPAGQG